MIEVTRQLAAIVPDLSDAWSADRAYPKNTWIFYNNQNWTARRDTLAGEEPGQSAAWLPGPRGMPNNPQNWFLTRDKAGFEDGFFVWANNNNGTGILTPKVDILVRVWCQAGGGGGGGGFLTKLTAGGGGAGGECISAALRLAAGAAVPVTIGVGGAGGVGVIPSASQAQNGASGGTSSFGAYISAAGGGGGDGFSNLAAELAPCKFNAGGPARNYNANAGYVRATAPGLSASLLALSAAGIPMMGISGAGGSSPFGRGGIHRNPNNWAGNVGLNGEDGAGYGSGGGGGAGYGAPFSGGNGAPGCIYIERII